MSIRTFFNSIKEGFKGIVRHPLVTVASITTILLMLIVMSAFFIFSANARHIMTKLEKEPPIEIYMELGVSEADLAATEQMLTSDPAIIKCEARTPEGNYFYFKDNLGESGSILDNFDYNNYLPYTFNIQIDKPENADLMVKKIAAYPGVSKVDKESNVMNFLTDARKVVNVATVAAFAVLFLIALFIISNMVRISVYARSSEIEIMKFVGATNNYIRMPYIIEGGIVGLISAVCAWAISVLVYRQIFYSAMHNVNLESFYALLPAGNILWWVLIINVLIGVLIGGIGSGISVRKYVKV